MDHVAIVKPEYLELILTGEKRIEARFSKTRKPPFGCVYPGDRIFFKASGGGFGAMCITLRVLSAPDLEPSDIEAIERQYGGRIRAPREFWDRKRSARYGTLVWLTFVQATAFDPEYRSSPAYRPREAWIPLGESARQRMAAPRKELVGAGASRSKARRTKKRAA